MKSSTPSFYKLVQTLALLLGLLSFSACQKKAKPSFIILAVDRLSFNAFSCNEERTTTITGLNTLCQESIRYTNAYTTSTQPAAALASLLTGVYPYQHQLHRSFDRIDPHYPLVTEYFKKMNYRTSFWSASPEIMKKTGLSRGFDIFDDSSFLTQNNFSVNFDDQVKLFKNWVEDSNDPFFSVIHNSDLEVWGDEDTMQAKLDLFNERLGKFIQYLKTENLWEQNYVIVLGLQGRSDYNRPDETQFSNIHSENVNIAFFIKPPRQKGDEGVSLKIDTPSSIVDFGLSLIKLIEPAHESKQNETFPVGDFSNLWVRNQLKGVELNQNRKILLESANTWKENLELRLGLISGNYIYLEGATNTLFNKLTDGLETIDIAKSSPDIEGDNKNSLRLIRQITNTPTWTNYEGDFSNYVKLNKFYWSNATQRDLAFENEKLRLQKDKKSNPLSTLLIYYLNEKKPKDAIYEDARRASYNLSIENMWGLWNKNKIWAQPGVTTEYQ
ncbi:MAG: sulfatase-like hydrolase/transferase [Pseudobdellovibrio sp.]